MICEELTMKLSSCLHRDHSVGVSYGRPHPSAVLEVSEREAVMACAGECVKGEERERRRRENRAELVKQLAEVELSERKERSKVSETLHLKKQPSHTHV